MRELVRSLAVLAVSPLPAQSSTPAEERLDALESRLERTMFVLQHGPYFDAG